MPSVRQHHLHLERREKAEKATNARIVEVKNSKLPGYILKFVKIYKQEFKDQPKWKENPRLLHMQMRKTTSNGFTAIGAKLGIMQCNLLS